MSNFLMHRKTYSRAFYFFYFTCHYRANKLEPDEIWLDNLDSIDNSNFIEGAPVKFMVHGFGGTIRGEFPWVLKNGSFNQCHSLLVN